MTAIGGNRSLITTKDSVIVVLGLSIVTAPPDGYFEAPLFTARTLGLCARPHS